MTYASILANAELNWNGDADENGTGDANDNTANARDGTWTGTAAYGTAPYGAGKSFVLDGSSKVARVYGSASGNRCVSCWFKTTTSGQLGTIITFANDSTTKLEININASNKLQVVRHVTTTDIEPDTLNDGNWHHVAAVHNGTDLRFYLDGSLVHTDSVLGGFFANTELVVGNRFSGAISRPFTGEVYDVIVEVGGTAWSATDIADLYAEGTTPADTTAPTLTSAVISSTGDTITLTFDEAVTGNTGVTLVAPTAVTMTYSSGDTTTALVYTLSRTVGYSESLLLNYTAGNITDIATNALATISDFLVTNQSLVGAGGSGTVLASGIKTGGQL